MKRSAFASVEKRVLSRWAEEDATPLVLIRERTYPVRADRLGRLGVLNIERAGSRSEELLIGSCAYGLANGLAMLRTPNADDAAILAGIEAERLELVRRTQEVMDAAWKRGDPVALDRIPREGTA